MKFPNVIGVVTASIVLFIVFFGAFTPIAFFLRISGRDRLRLKLSKEPTYWISCRKTMKPGSFKQQV